MLTQAELNALVQLLQRTPMTQLEFLEIQDIIAKLQADIMPPMDKMQEPTDLGPEP